MKETGRGSWLVMKGKNSGLYIVERKKTHGGLRKGSGAKKKPEHLKKEKTKVMRIPISKVNEVLKTIGK